MRRRVVDIGLAALGAALVLAVVQGARVLADQIAIPKSWTIGEVLTSADLNGNFAAITAVVNGNLDDANLKGAAAIKGTKLADAPNGVSTTKVNDLAVTTPKLADLAVTTAKLADNAVNANKIADGSIVDADVNAAAAIAGTKLAVGAAHRNFASGTCIAGLNVTTTETTVATVSLTAGGGVVYILPSCGFSFLASTGSGNLTWRWKRGGVTAVTITVPIVGSPGVALTVWPTLAAPPFVGQPPAGAQTYDLTAQFDVAVGALLSNASAQGHVSAVELR
jgi:hypothetical protein